MTTMTASTPEGPLGLLRRVEAWLDARGKPAWLIATLAAFLVFWPLGLALLAYAIWSNRMFTGSCSRRAGRHTAMKSTGNSAFDAYKEDTLRRLEQEQEAFETFLKRLRDAKDKEEFDQFMKDRSETASARPEVSEA